jgi:hypothetical protein
MNSTGVDNGRYVLLQIHDESQNGDKVASEIISKDDREVIRTYLQKEDSAILAHKPIIQFIANIKSTTNLI